MYRITYIEVLRKFICLTSGTPEKKWVKKHIDFVSKEEPIRCAYCGDGVSIHRGSILEDHVEHLPYQGTACPMHNSEFLEAEFGLNEEVG